MLVLIILLILKGCPAKVSGLLYMHSSLASVLYSHLDLWTPSLPTLRAGWLCWILPLSAVVWTLKAKSWEKAHFVSCFSWIILLHLPCLISTVLKSLVSFNPSCFVLWLFQAAGKSSQLPHFGQKKSKLMTP